MHVVFLGCGNMGGALLDGILSKSVLEASNISIVERNADRVVTLKDKGLTVKSVPSELDRPVDILVLAIKPQIFQSVASDIADVITPATSLLSIMAGVSSSVIAKNCNHTGPIVRSMPNLPVQIGKGMALYAYSEQLPEEHEEFIQHMFSATGKVIRVAQERLIDAGTAISGSGPAYIFLFIETLIKIADKSGFKNSKNMVLQTFLGSLLLLLNEKDSPTHLKKSVTSKGGTTEAALKILENKNGLSTLISKAIDKAKKRSRELSKAN